MSHYIDTNDKFKTNLIRSTASFSDEGRIGITFGNLRLTNSYCNWSYGIMVNFEI